MHKNVDNQLGSRTPCVFVSRISRGR